MKVVTRKSFRDLSTRQRYARIHAHREFRQSLVNNQSNISENSTPHSNILPNVNVENPQNVEVEQHVIIPENQSRILRDIDKDKSDEELVIGDPLVDVPRVDTLENFKNLLKQCCVDMNINHVQTRALLRVLRTHRCFKNLRKDSRTLLKTSRNRLCFSQVGSGVYWHIGFVKPLQKHLLFYDDDQIPLLLELEFSTDGLSLSKSNPMQFWPLQYRVLNIPGFKPLMIGIYKGSDKPTDVETFFQPFLDEVEQARRSGGILVRNRRIPFSFDRFIGDGPARALVMKHYGHNSTCPCSKCKVSGFRFENRVMVYLGIDHRKRTNDEYASQIDECHRKPGKSPLIDLGIPMVTGVPFEIMHLVYLGVTVRLLEAWYIGKFGLEAKLCAALFNELSSRHLLLDKWCPDDFARRPILLSKFGRFKATQLRHFILYAAPVILLGILPDEYYFHLLLLNVAMRILTSPVQSEKRLKKARRMLNTFVIFAEALYTPAFVSYNVHGLSHLVDDAKQFGSLEGCAAFIYENNMPLFRKNIRNHPKPLQQFANRLQEKSDIQHVLEKPLKRTYSQVTTRQENDVVPDCVAGEPYMSYKKYKSSQCTLTLDNRNDYCQLKDKSICKLDNIIVLNNKVFGVVRKFQSVVDFYSKPIKSSKVGVYKCSDLSADYELISMKRITTKCYCMPSWSNSFASTRTPHIIDGEYIISTLQHTN